VGESPLRSLPAVHILLSDPALADETLRHGRAAVLAAARAELEAAREAIRQGQPIATDPAAIVARVRGRLGCSSRRAVRPVLNATGVLLHTGLGRAPLAAEAIEAVAEAARGYCALEFNLETGERGRRSDAVSGLLRELTGAEAAAVVNNNAAATVLALKALAAGREVIVSRGQLVEIGGSFRLPEIFAASGAILREVGTTNRTRLADYERAIGPQTAVLLRVHASNFRIVGFTETVEIGELAALGRSRGLWTIDDIGSGALAPGRPAGIGADEPTAAQSLAAGADLVLFSGDKLLGGPQCGVLLGTREVIRRITSDPLMRALRVDKMTLAALEATLRLARDPERAHRRIPLWAALTTSTDFLLKRAQALASELRRDPGLNADAWPTEARFGGGSAPGQALDSAAVRIAPPWPEGVDASELARRLRTGEPTVVPRIQSGWVLLDLRAIPEGDDPALLAAVRCALGTGSDPTAREAPGPPPLPGRTGPTWGRLVRGPEFGYDIWPRILAIEAPVRRIIPCLSSAS
jgi:L-seryl-tRNA(Ser) seleniumtransferase